MNAETGEVYSTCVNTTCPPIDPLCAQEDIVTSEDGCCTYCKPTPKSLGEYLCYNLILTAKYLILISLIIVPLIYIGEILRSEGV